MTMNNNTSTAINTTSYTLKCESDSIISLKTYSLVTATGSITCSATGSWTAPVLTLANVVTTGTHTGNFAGYFAGGATGHFTGDADLGILTVTPAPIPIPPLSPGAPSSPPTAEVVSPEPFKEFEVPQTPLTFNKLLKLYLEYVTSEFKYLGGIFTNLFKIFK